ncbi:MAG: NHL repeat-containing protein [Candidatus Cybelea sp.]
MLLSFRKYVIATATGISLLTSCAGGSSPPAVPLAIHASQSNLRARGEACPCVYVANVSNQSITVYPSGATRNAKPIQNLRGSNTGLDPGGIAVDGSGNMYVANTENDSVTVYAAGATGNAAPMQTISGSSTRLDNPYGIALDPVNGDIYVANHGVFKEDLGSVTVYSAGSNGNVAPIGTIAGANTGLYNPFGIILDPSGNIYVANDKSITVYASGSVGNVAPAQTISGSDSGAQGFFELGLDSSLNIYAAKPAYRGRIEVYAAGSNGDVGPIRTIAGRKTKLFYPAGIALDNSGNVYITNDGTEIYVYAAGASGKVKPIHKIGGSKTGIDDAVYITIR